MKVYRVRVKSVYEQNFRVEAKNENEARERADVAAFRLAEEREPYHSYYLDSDEWDVEEVNR